MRKTELSIWQAGSFSMCGQSLGFPIQCASQGTFLQWKEKVVLQEVEEWMLGGEG
jgi:hypothetical protein